MLGHSAIAEAAFADSLGGILQAGVAEMSGIASKTSVGVGILTGGEINIDGNFTQTSTGTFISAGASTDVSMNFITTIEAFRVDVTDIDLTTEFTQTSNGIMILTTSASKNFIFTKSAAGDLMFVEVNAGATEETFTTITPSGTETYTEITPSGTETWTEIQ